MFKQGNSCVGCATVFLAFIVIMGLLGVLSRYGWVIILVAAVALIYWARKKNEQKQQQPQKQKQNDQAVRESPEKIVLQIAARNQGLVTPMEIVLASDLSMEEAGDILEEMRKKGYANLRVADNGSYVYEIEGLLSMQQKRDSEKI